MIAFDSADAEKADTIPANNADPGSYDWSHNFVRFDLIHSVPRGIRIDSFVIVLHRTIFDHMLRGEGQKFFGFYW